MNEHVISLKPHQIFVFGSNLNGFHDAGAAKQAQESFGAVNGIGVGPMGQSYAIPTMDGWDRLANYSYQFLEFAKSRPDLEFLLTPIGTGIAGYSLELISVLFEDLPSNVQKVGWL